MNGFGFNPLQFATVIKKPVTYYVDGSVVASGDGLSWETAFKTIAEATGLLTGKVFLGNVTINIEAGTYNEPLYLTNVFCLGTLSIYPREGNVILTGSYITPTGKASYSSYIEKIMASCFNLGLSAYRFIASPNSFGTLFHNVFHFYDVINETHVYVDIDDMSGYPSTNKRGFDVQRTTKITIHGGSCNNATLAFDIYNSEVYVSGVSGSGNTTVISALNGSCVYLNSNTITGTTLYVKSSSLIVNIDGTLL
jgi:hypothetical protein